MDAPAEEFDAARIEISALVEELVKTRSRELLKIDHKIHKHLIGKAGANINKIKADTGVNIRIPQDEDNDIEVSKLLSVQQVVVQSFGKLNLK